MSERLARAAPPIACFLLVAGVYLAHFAYAGYERFYWDAAHYWELAREFETEDGFSLYGFEDPLRGYALPLFWYLLQEIAAVVGAGDVVIVRVFGGLLAATLGVVIAPRLARALFSEAQITWPRVLALNGLIFLFWRDHFQFPLADFPALVLACVGVIAFLRATAIGYVAAGLCFGVAAYVRPNYALIVGAAVVAAALYRRQERNWMTRVAGSALVLVAAAAVSVPQVLVNKHHHDSWSPTVSNARGIGMEVLRAGLLVQRAQTHVGPDDEYPRDFVAYFDPVAPTVLDGKDVGTIAGYGDYARLVLSNPPVMAVSYALHAFNGLNVRYPTPYIRDLRDRPVLLPLLQFSLLFVALLKIVVPDARRRLGDVRWLVMLFLVLPIVNVIPFPIDPRYFVGVHLLVYLLVCFGPGTIESLVRGTRHRQIALGVSYVVFLAAYLALAAAIEAQLEFPLDG